MTINNRTVVDLEVLRNHLSEEEYEKIKSSLSESEINEEVVQSEVFDDSLKEAEEEKYILGTTKSGFEYKILKENFLNMELYELFSAETENEMLIAIPKALKLMMGQEQKNALYDHLRKDNGIVNILDVYNAMHEIMTNQNNEVEIKN